MMSGLFAPHDEYDKRIVKYFKNVFGFRPHNLDVYKLALTHRSAANSQADRGNNERLEYLGDAVLELLISDYLFKKYPCEQEGPLTQMRSKLVSRERLNALSRKIDLQSIIRIKSNTRTVSAGGNAFEAVVGAIFLEKGYQKTKKIMLEHIFLTHLDIDAIFTEDTNYKSQILNWAQKQHKKFEFVHDDVSENKGRKVYRTRFILDGKVIGEGTGYTLKAADQEAAEKALEKIEDNEKE